MDNHIRAQLAPKKTTSEGAGSVGVIGRNAGAVPGGGGEA